MHSNSALLLYAAIAVAGLIILTVRFKLSAFVALTIASIFLGLCAGLEPPRLMKAFADGLGAVLGSIALVIALGTMIGRVLAETGGADAVSEKLLSLFGERHLGVAFCIIGLVVGLPVFFPVGLVLLLPILFTVTREKNLPLLTIGVPMAAGLSSAHGYIPPHPGPLAAIELLHADLGKTLLYSLPVGLVAGLAAGPLLVRFFRDALLHPQKSPGSTISSAANRPQASFLAALATILLPIALIASATLADFFLPAESALKPVFQLAGHPISALLIGLLFAYLTLARGVGFSRQQILKMSEDSLAPVAVILLVVGAGAGFSRVLIESGAGKAVAEIAVRWNLHPMPMAFVLAALIRIATGSATVAITTAAGLLKPIADARPGTNLELLVLATASGSVILSHVNDGGFWLVKEYLNLSVPQTLRTWTILETVLGVAGFISVLLLQLFM
ncbi:MAG TPA: gluconate:H+ symporter [Verrucomicrobiae bacterium]|jgi:GntP family gluconate:H+ symporter|nr:gluconate:H+ symporter [Verrucomicrobiae bacterium]